MLLAHWVNKEENISNARLFGMLFGEKGKAAASGIRRRNLVPVRLRGALKLLKLRSHKWSGKQDESQSATSR